MPPAPGLAGNSLRQIVQLSLGGERLRLSFSNAFGAQPLNVVSAHVARASEGGAIAVASDQPLRFGGAEAFSIAAGASVVSDPIDFQVAPLELIAVTLAFDAVLPSPLTGHPASHMTSFLQTGNAVSAPELGTAEKLERWYFLNAVDAWTDQRARAIVTFGDSITDGSGSTTDKNDRWPDQLARRLLGAAAPSHIAVLNQGIGGNRILRDGMGPNALSRFERDALAPAGVRWIIVLEGINDIGTAAAARAKGEPAATAQDLIDAYRKMIGLAHARGLRIYAGTILPYQGAQYFSEQGEADRQTVNTWIRQSGEFDAVIDFDAFTRDPAAPSRLSAAADNGDHLHPSPAGYKIMADGIDLGLFSN
jgi:lysophospholipase L1-like esterase